MIRFNGPSFTSVSLWLTVIGTKASWLTTLCFLPCAQYGVMKAILCIPGNTFVKLFTNLSDVLRVYMYMYMSCKSSWGFLHTVPAISSLFPGIIITVE